MKDKKMFQTKSLIDIGEVTYLFGAFFAILSCQKVYPGLITYPITNDTWEKITSRTFIATLLVAPWILLLYFMKHHSKISDPYALLLFQGIIPAIGTGFSLFLFADLVSKKLGVLPANEDSKQEDIEEEEKGKLLK